MPDFIPDLIFGHTRIISAQLLLHIALKIPFHIKNVVYNLPHNSIPAGYTHASGGFYSGLFAQEPQGTLSSMLHNTMLARKSEKATPVRCFENNPRL